MIKKIILFLVSILIFTCDEIRAQYRRPAIIGDSIFQFINLKERLDTLLPISINVQLDSVYYDTCNWYNNSLDFEIKLENKAKREIYYKSEIYVWDDSGFGSERYQLDGMNKIKPNTFGILKIHIRNTMRWNFNRQGYYTIFYNNKQIYVPISLRLQYSPKGCSMSYEERMSLKH